MSLANRSKFETPIHCGDHVYIQPTYFIIKPDYIGHELTRSKRQIENQKNLLSNKSHGQLSSKSMSKLKNSVNWLLSAAKYKAVYSKRDRKTFWFKTNFITLTIPPQTSYSEHSIKLKLDSKNIQPVHTSLKSSVPINYLPTVSSAVFQKCLNVFLTYSRKHSNIKLYNYVWKLEAHKDGRLHVHISSDIFYHYMHLRAAWNRILLKNNLLENHYKIHGNYDPNSTDVHSVYKVRNVAGYICGYMQKKPNLSKDFEGRIWSCSYSLSQKNKCYCYLEKDTDRRNLSFVDRPMIRYKQIQSKPDCMGNTKTVASMYMLYGTQRQTEMDGIIKEAYNRHRLQIRNNTPSQPPEYLTIDFFGQKSKGNYEYISGPDNEVVKCAIVKNTVKNGQMSFDLQY